MATFQEMGLSSKQVTVALCRFLSSSMQSPKETGMRSRKRNSRTVKEQVYCRHVAIAYKYTSVQDCDVNLITTTAKTSYKSFKAKLQTIWDRHCNDQQFLLTSKSQNNWVCILPDKMLETCGFWQCHRQFQLNFRTFWQFRPWTISRSIPLSENEENLGGLMEYCIVRECKTIYWRHKISWLTAMWGPFDIVFDPNYTQSRLYSYLIGDIWIPCEIGSSYLSRPELVAVEIHLSRRVGYRFR